MSDKMSWHNYKIGEDETIEMPSDFTDYIPQYGTAQNLYRLHMKLGDEPVEAARKVWGACIGERERGADVMGGLTETPALKLWADWFAGGGDPLYASEGGGDLYCFFCGEFFVKRNNEAHAPDCIYLRAKMLIKWALEVTP